MVKYLYTLPLVSSTNKQHRGACYFTKLDLRSASNLVRIQEGDDDRLQHTVLPRPPILKLPDPQRLFIIEVKPPAVEVGSCCPKAKVSRFACRMCAYFSRKLTPVERKLRRRQPGTPGRKVSIGGVETLARGITGALHCPH